MQAALTWLGFLIASLLPCTGAAHEFWLWPEPMSAPVGGVVRLGLRVGEYFDGEATPFAAQYASALRRYSDGRSENLLERARIARPRAELALTLPTEGAHLIAYDSRPSAIVLAADKFHAYLHDEGLDDIVETRVAAGTAMQPGRERYWRCVKTLVRVGGKSDLTYAVRTGQRLEIVPLGDPLAASAGTRLGFALYFDGRPLAKRLVKAWHKREGQTVIIRARSDQSGQLALNLPYAGAWMVSVVHMIPATGADDADWDSFWGNLTFELAP